MRLLFGLHLSVISSLSRNMINNDPTTNVGFDFDVNIAVNDVHEV